MRVTLTQQVQAGGHSWGPYIHKTDYISEKRLRSLSLSLSLRFRASGTPFITCAQFRALSRNAKCGDNCPHGNLPDCWLIFWRYQPTFGHCTTWISMDTLNSFFADFLECRKNANSHGGTCINKNSFLIVQKKRLKIYNISNFFIEVSLKSSKQTGHIININVKNGSENATPRISSQETVVLWSSSYYSFS